MKTLFLLISLLGVISVASDLKTENSIRIGFAGYPISNLYYLGYDDYSEAVSSLVLEPLVRLNSDTLAPEPALAKHFYSNSINTRFEFELNPQARFSDASSVTIEDVLFTWSILKSPPPQLQAYASQFSQLNDCKLENSKVVFTSEKPIAAGSALFSQFFVLSKKHFSGRNFTKDFNETFIGSGPYVFDKVQWGNSIFLTKNKTYWGTAEPFSQGKYSLDRIEFHTQSDPSLLFQMLLKHEIDYLYFLSAKSWAIDTQHPLFKTGAIRKLEVKNKVSFGMAGIAWNFRKPLFQDKRVRKALSLLLDRERLIRDFFYDQYQPTTGIAYFGSEFHHPENRPLPFDPKQAKHLLSEAGWTLNAKKVLERNAQIFSFEILSGNPPAAKYLALYQEDLRKLGIQVSIRVVDWGTFLKLRNEGQFDALDFSRNRDDYMTDLDQTWSILGFSNSKANEILNRLRSSYSRAARVKWVQTLDKLFSDEFPMAFTWEPRFQRIAFWNRYTFNGLGYHPYSKWNELFHEWQWIQSNQK
ncbi:MAG: ABC transporter substrate-binding protein [Pseudomonadota bacterium]